VLTWCCCPVNAQEGRRKPVAVEEIEYLLQRGVSARRVATIVGEQGVSFEVTESVKERLRKAGADEGVIIAVERAGLETARQKLEEERRKAAEERRQLEEEKREADAERKRQETEARRKAEEERKAGEAKRQEEAARRAEEERQQQAAAARQRQTGEMVAVPAGEFFLGCNEQVDSECDDDEKPGRRVSVAAFQIDKTEVTVAQYGRCVDAGACSSDGLTLPYWGDKEQPEFAWACNWGKGGREQHPMNCVEWRQAQAYCTWAGKRLPTEAEWEKAARGTDGRKYPWGNQGYGAAGQVANIADETAKRSQPDWSSAAGYDDNFYGTAPVGSFPAGASPYGALDMVGNVWEWTADWYDAEHKYRSNRGGSWGDLPRWARASGRDGLAPGLRDVGVGFRCAQ
jgi:formylglycine-generating enzyme required for sulfatase activity